MPSSDARPMEDQVGAVFGLADEQAMAPRTAAAFAVGEEWNQDAQPAQHRVPQIVRRERVGKLLQTLGVRTRQERIPALAKTNPFRAHPQCQPLVAVDADPRVLAALEYHRHARLSPTAVVEPFDPLVPPNPFRWRDDRNPPPPGQLLDPLVILDRHAAEVFSRQPRHAAMLSQEPHDARWRLQHLNHRIEQHTIKTGVTKPDTSGVTFCKSVHGGSPHGVSKTP